MGAYLQFLYSPSGRVSRKDIWLKYLLASIIASMVATIVDMSIGLGESGPFGAMVSLFFFWPAIAVSIKRFHDRNMSGWWVLLIYILVIGGVAMAISPFMGPILDNLDDLNAIDGDEFEAAFSQGGGPILLGVGLLLTLGATLFAFVVNYCLPGDVGPNQYGPDPLDPMGAAADAFE